MAVLAPTYQGYKPKTPDDGLPKPPGAPGTPTGGPTAPKPTTPQQQTSAAVPPQQPATPSQPPPTFRQLEAQGIARPPSPMYDVSRIGQSPFAAQPSAIPAGDVPAPTPVPTVPSGLQPPSDPPIGSTPFGPAPQTKPTTQAEFRDYLRGAPNQTFRNAMLQDNPELTTQMAPWELAQLYSTGGAGTVEGGAQDFADVDPTQVRDAWIRGNLKGYADSDDPWGDLFAANPSFFEDLDEGERAALQASIGMPDPIGTGAEPAGNQSGTDALANDPIASLLLRMFTGGPDATAGADAAYARDVENIDDDFTLRNRATADDFTRRGLYDSTLLGDRTRDLNVGRRSAMEEAAFRKRERTMSDEAARRDQTLDALSAIMGYNQQLFNNDVTQEQINSGYDSDYTNLLLSLFGGG